MSYLFIGALLIVAIQSQFEECDPICSDPTPICNYFGGSVCVAKCSSNDDCALPTPICDTQSGACVVCQQDADCLNNTVFANTTYCVNYAPIFDGNICSDSPSQFCTNTAECTRNFGDEFICLTLTSDDADDLGFCANSTDFGEAFCTSDTDCEQDGGPFDEEAFFQGLDVSCQTLTVPFPEEVEILQGYQMSLDICIPDDQCSEDTDCLPGSECRDFSFDDVFGFSICNFKNETCSQDIECSTDGTLKCYEPENTCYLPCDSNEDCRNDAVNNWACGIPPNMTEGEEIMACLPFGIENVTFLTNSPTAAPVEEPGVSAVSPLQIFVAIIIMIINSIFI